MEEIAINQLSQSSPAALLVIALGIFGSILKSIPNSRFPDWAIPWGVTIAGAAIWPLLKHDFTFANVLIGFIAGSASVGVHQIQKQTIQRKNDQFRLIAASTLEPRTGGAGMFNEPAKQIVREAVNDIKASASVASLILLCLIPLFFSACATTQQGQSPVSIQQNVDRTAALVKTSAALGTFYALKEEPGSRAYFEAIVPVFTLALQDGVYDPVQLQARIQEKLQDLPIKELKTDEASFGIQAATALYGAFFAEQVSKALDQNVYVRPVLIALRDGIVASLGIEPTTSAASVLVYPKAESPKGKANRE